MARNKGKTADLSSYKAPGDGSAKLKTYCLVACCILALVLLYLLCQSLWGMLYTNNKHFLFTTLQFHSTNNFPAERIISDLTSLGIEERQITLANIDLWKIRKHFMSSPLVESVQIRRIIPGTLAIDLQERVPVAWLVCSPRLAIDKNGIVLPSGLKGCPSTLPQITGIKKPGELKIGEKTDDRMLQGALAYLQQAKIREESFFRSVSVIQLDGGNGTLTLYLDANGIFTQNARIIIPLKEMNKALDRLVGIVLERSASNQSISFIDVTFERNIPVKP